MDLEGFEPTASTQGDSLKASDAVGKPLIVKVNERRENIKTKFQPEGAPGVILDVADIAADTVYVGILWMNGAIVDNLSPYVGKSLPVKLAYQAGKSGGYSYIAVEALKGTELQAAQAWGAQNDGRFDARRTELAGQVQAQAAATGATGDMTQVAAAAAPAPADGQSDIQALLAQLAQGQAK